MAASTQGVPAQNSVIPRQTRNTAQAVEKVVDLAKYTDTSMPIEWNIFQDESFIVRGNQLKRSLVVNEGVVTVDRLDVGTLRVRGNRVGPTVLYVWGDNGRYTFKVRVMLPQLLQGSAAWENPDHFKFSYDNDWRNYYEGPTSNTLQRKTIIWDQNVGARGPTPYGDFDTSAQWSYVGNKEQIEGYTVGLSAGHLWQFDGFNVRGFDFSDAFSPLTFPGTTLRGIFFNSPAFHDNINYTLIYGSDRRSYGYLTSGVTSNTNSYIEGAQVRIFPRANNNFTLNYAEGFGSDRESFLKKQVYSLESNHRWANLIVDNEVADDGSNRAVTSVLAWRFPKGNFRIALRDIEPRFLTITGQPSNNGEAGSMISGDWHPNEHLAFNNSLDIYRDRINFNPGSRDDLNYNYNGSAQVIFNPTTNLNTNVYYTNTPQLSFPSRNLSATSTLNKNIPVFWLGKNYLNVYGGFTYQDSVNPLSPTSDYERDAVVAGLRVPLIPYLYAYSSYSYSWLRETQSGQRSTPQVLEAGLDYSRSFTKKLSGGFRFLYHKEQNAGSLHSFLAGEDSMEGSLNLTYSPYRDVQFFGDAKVRRVWPVTSNAQKYSEVDVHLGAKILWDSPLVWSPLTRIEGHVFKDANGNGKREDGEEPIAGARIHVGPQTVISDKDGFFRVEVRAKTVTATMDVNSVPTGYVLTSPNAVRVNTQRGGVKKLDFGISAQSGVYGIVFYDVKGDGKYDAKQDKPMAKVKIYLDDHKYVAMTNNEGVYFFSNVSLGKHTLSLDLASVPMQYLPTVEVRRQIDVVEGSTYAYHIPLKKK